MLALPLSVPPILNAAAAFLQALLAHPCAADELTFRVRRFSAGVLAYGRDATYNALRRLEGDGLVRRYRGESGPNRRGRRSEYFRLTSDGRRTALRQREGLVGLCAQRTSDDPLLVAPRLPGRALPGDLPRPKFDFVRAQPVTMSAREVVEKAQRQGLHIHRSYVNDVRTQVFGRAQARRRSRKAFVAALPMTMPPREVVAEARKRGLTLSVHYVTDVRRDIKRGGLPARHAPRRTVDRDG